MFSANSEMQTLPTSFKTYFTIISLSPIISIITSLSPKLFVYNGSRYFIAGFGGSLFKIKFLKVLY